jgi:peptide/nickel transport system substrate-binding protein
MAAGKNGMSADGLATEEGAVPSDGLTRRDAIKRGGALALGLGLAAPLANVEPARAFVTRRFGAAATPLDTLVVAVEGDIDTFDPSFTVGSPVAQTVVANVFDQLSQYKQAQKTLGGVSYPGVNTEQVIGLMAQSIQTKGDRVVFTLKQGLRYHDGTPLNANTVAEGYKRIFGTESIGALLLNIGGIPKASDVRALDSRRVEFRMHPANLMFLKCNTTQNHSIINPAEVKAHATSKDPWATGYFKKNIATGNGPWALEEYVPGDRIVLAAADNYTGKKPALARVIMKIVTDPSQRILLLKRGEVDMIMQPPVRELNGLKRDSNLQVLSVPRAQSLYFEMNNAIPPFDNKLVRQAVAWALPYEAILRNVYFNYGAPCGSVICKDMPTADYSAWRYRTNLDQAKRLLDQAGFPGGDGAPPITITARADVQEWVNAAVLISASLRQLGLNASVRQLPLAPYNEQQQGKKLQSWLGEFYGWVQDPYYQMFWRGNSGSPLNFVGFNNKQYDALLDKWTLSTNRQRRDAASRAMQRIMTQELPVAYLNRYNYNIAMRKNVRGYRVYNDVLTRFVYMSKVA